MMEGMNEEKIYNELMYKWVNEQMMGMNKKMDEWMNEWIK